MKSNKFKSKKLICLFLFPLFRFETDLIKFGFLIFPVQFWTNGNFTASRPKAEKLPGSGKKIIRFASEERFLEPKQKKVIALYAYRYLFIKGYLRLKKITSENEVFQV